MKQLESLLYDFIINNNKGKCKKYINTFCSLSSPSYLKNIRKGALLGFYAIIKVVKIINNENNNPNEILHADLFDDLKGKIFDILEDTDADIVYSAAQILYNIMVSFNSYALINLKFFFEALFKIVARNEYKIKVISERLENALKSIINYSFQNLQKGYELYEFFKIIIENLSLKSSDDKRLAVSLIICFNQIPNFQLINILHLFIKDLFEMLKDPLVKPIAKKCLDNFYIEIDDVPFNVEKAILNTIIAKIKSLDNDNNNLDSRIIMMDIKFTALKWINSFLKKIKKKYLDTKERSSESLKKKEEKIEDYFEIFIEIPKIIFDIFKNKDDDTDKIFSQKDDKNDMTFNQCINEINNCLIAIIKSPNVKKEDKKKLEFEKIITDYLTTENKYLLLPLVNWVTCFFELFEEEAFSNRFEFIEKFSFILTSKDEKIFNIGMEALNKMFDKENSMKEKDIKEIIEKFLNKLENKEIEFVIQRTLELIKSLSPKIKITDIYKSFADVLEKMENQEFVIKIINILNNYLLTSNNAKILKFDGSESNEFFKMLFKTWSKNSISCLILCLIAEDFELSYNLLKNFGKIRLTQDDLKEYSQIIQIFESKEFTSKFIFIITVI